MSGASRRGPARKVLLLHPGAMGATVGATLAASGQRVCWLAVGRSKATSRRAEAGRFERFERLDAALNGTDAVVSVCPPEAALAVAERVAGAGHAGLYLDANAVSPATVRRMGVLFGDRLVDGGIVGPPAEHSGTTRLYLSGPAAAEAAGWFAAGPLEARPLDGPAGAASALKMCYAAYTKGSTALLLAVRALAEAEGVASALTGEWAISQRGLEERSENAAGASSGKAWRFAGEMQEIADTFRAAGLPDGFHRAAAELYQRLAPLKDQSADLDAVLGLLLTGSRAGPGA